LIKNNFLCRKVLRKNGSAVDATIATLFCNGLIASQSMGIGGGFLMTVYDKKSGKATTIDGRETAPEAATLDMYHGNATLSTRGGLAVAVPGEIRGYYEAKQRFGNINVTWASLIQPSIDMARNGIPVTFSKADALKGSKDAIMSDPGMFEVYINPATNDTWKEGDTYKRTKLADTLERIAKYGHIEFYEGKTAKSFVEDLNKLGGIITLNDLKNYKYVLLYYSKVHVAWVEKSYFCYYFL
jgi:gamma-glutamyltranspeptidase/glutathione hydrolase/leukotriene-C4 hydrolase